MNTTAEFETHCALPRTWRPHYERPGKTVRSAAILLLLAGAACGPSRVVVTIENRGTEPLQSVAIWAGTFTRFMGNVASGQTATDTLPLEGEGPISLQHGNNPRKTMALVDYFSAGHLDSIRAEITVDSVLKVQHWPW